MQFSPPPPEAEHLEILGQNATKYFDKKFKNMISLHGTQWATYPDGESIYFLRKTYWDEHIGILYRIIIMKNLGKNPRDIETISDYQFDDIPQVKNLISDSTPIGTMPMAPKIFIYTNKLYTSMKDIKTAFAIFQPDSFIDVIEESNLHKTLFISYGGPDEKIAKRINTAIKSRGVETWFFPENSIPGDKLHRMMSEAVYKYDRTLLICSKESISRYGVLNEVERMLEREASEGGSNIIIPVTLDNYIFDEWNPERKDIKQQVLSRVVIKINDENFESEIEKILLALRN